MTPACARVGPSAPSIHMPSATSLYPSPLKSPALIILSPTLAAAARLPILTFASVSRSTDPPAFSGPAMAAGAIAALSAVTAPAQASARRRLVFNTPQSLSWADQLANGPSPQPSWPVHQLHVVGTSRSGEPERPARIDVRDEHLLRCVVCELRPSRLARIHFTSDEEQRTCGRPLRCSPSPCWEGQSQQWHERPTLTPLR